MADGKTVTAPWPSRARRRGGRLSHHLLLVHRPGLHRPSRRRHLVRFGQKLPLHRLVFLLILGLGLLQSGAPLMPRRTKCFTSTRASAWQARSNPYLPVGRSPARILRRPRTGTPFCRTAIPPCSPGSAWQSLRASAIPTPGGVTPTAIPPGRQQLHPVSCQLRGGAALLFTFWPVCGGLFAGRLANLLFLLFLLPGRSSERRWQTRVRPLALLPMTCIWRPPSAGIPTFWPCAFLFSAVMLDLAFGPREPGLEASCSSRPCWA